MQSFAGFIAPPKPFEEFEELPPCLQCLELAESPIGFDGIGSPKMPDTTVARVGGAMPLGQGQLTIQAAVHDRKIFAGMLDFKDRMS